MKLRSIIWVSWALLGGLLVVGCGSEPYMSTRGVEERFIGIGHSRDMFNYGETMLRQGRYREAHAAYWEAETSAFTDEVRTVARGRRIWVEEALAAVDAGRPLPPLPNDMRYQPPAAGQAPTAIGNQTPPPAFGSNTQPPAPSATDVSAPADTGLDSPDQTPLLPLEPGTTPQAVTSQPLQ